MLPDPGVAMKMATSPPPGISVLICWPSCWPEMYSAWPTYASRLVPIFGDALRDETVGVVAEHRDARVHRVRCRGGERGGVDPCVHDPGRLGGDRGVEVAHHLRGQRGLRAAPLRGGQAEQRRRVLEAVLGGHEERVRGDVVDVPELPGRGLREVARRPLRRIAARAGPAAGGEQPGRGRRGADQPSAAEQPPPGRPVLHVESVDRFFDLGVDVPHLSTSTRFPQCPAGARAVPGRCRGATRWSADGWPVPGVETRNRDSGRTPGGRRHRGPRHPRTPRRRGHAATPGSHSRHRLSSNPVAGRGWASAELRCSATYGRPDGAPCPPGCVRSQNHWVDDRSDAPLVEP